MTNSAIQSQPIEIDPVTIAAGLRNKVLNGQLGIWQRGTSFSGPTGFANNTVFIAADRWNTSGRGGAPAIPIGNITVNQIDQVAFLPGQSDVPNDPLFYLQRQVIIIGGGTTDASILGSLIEDVRTLNGQRATLSFWAKGDPGDLAVNMGQRFGVGGSLGNITPEESFSLTPVWQKYVFFFDIPSIAGKTLGAAPSGGLQVRFYSHAGSSVFASGLTVNYTGNFCITNLQLEEGEVATPEFEVRPEGLELRLCQRYFETAQRDESTHGITNAARINRMWVNFKVEKLIPPTITMTVGVDPPTGSNVAPGSVSFEGITTNGFYIRFDTTPTTQDTRIRSMDPTQSFTDLWTAEAG